jgi:hypothetical protein
VPPPPSLTDNERAPTPRFPVQIGAPSSWVPLRSGPRPARCTVHLGAPQLGARSNLVHRSSGCPSARFPVQLAAPFTWVPLQLGAPSSSVHRSPGCPSARCTVQLGSPFTWVPLQLSATFSSVSRSDRCPLHLHALVSCPFLAPLQPDIWQPHITL